MTRITLMLAALTALAACSSSARDPHNATLSSHEPATPAAPTPAPAVAQPTPAAPSIYDLSLQLTSAQGSTIGLDAQRGHPVLISMFYGSCTVSCPLLISEVQQALAALPPDIARDTRVMLVSFDAARDTPAALTTLATERKLDDRWTLAAASDTDAQTLAAVLGFHYRRLADGNFAHGSTILALDRDGRPIGRVDALGQRDTLVRALTAAK